MLLNLEVSEYHPDHLSRGAQLSIHSPYHVPSPVSEGLFLNMGTVYRIYVRLVSRVLTILSHYFVDMMIQNVKFPSRVSLILVYSQNLKKKKRNSSSKTILATL